MSAQGCEDTAKAHHLQLLATNFANKCMVAGIRGGSNRTFATTSHASLLGGTEPQEGRYELVQHSLNCYRITY